MGPIDVSRMDLAALRDELLAPRGRSYPWCLALRLPVYICPSNPGRASVRALVRFRAFLPPEDTFAGNAGSAADPGFTRAGHIVCPPAFASGMPEKKARQTRVIRWNLPFAPGGAPRRV